MSQKLYSEIKNNSTPLEIKDIPVLDYSLFYDQVIDFLNDKAKHCVTYYCIDDSVNLKFFCCIADDNKNTIIVFSHELNKQKTTLKSLTSACSQLHIFEREINENYGVEFEGHPWLKPVRYPHGRYDTSKIMNNYPFYGIDSEELHEVGVGPIHAGVIEPGHFRFICNGEKVLHLEIQLGYQHRGIEKLITKNNQLQRCILSESIAGDSAVAHGLTHSQLIESLAGIEVAEELQVERIIALELERIAVHIGDTAALCGDVAYQLGQVACEALRTQIINVTQYWCGNRFGKGLMRPGGNNYPLNALICDEILKVINDTAERFTRATDLIYSLPSVLGRFDSIGILTAEQAISTGTVGMAARASGVVRDTRKSHPFQFYKNLPFQPSIIDSGDVLARGMLRTLEVQASVEIIREMIVKFRTMSHSSEKPVYDLKFKPDSLALSMVEGWRGEICHSAITDRNGRILHYKVKDPSFHNWMALALAVRNQEISDFPICNKSFNLSYCGNDL